MQLMEKKKVDDPILAITLGLTCEKGKCEESKSSSGAKFCEHKPKIQEFSEGEPPTNMCEYYTQKYIALTSNHSLWNYHSFFQLMLNKKAFAEYIGKSVSIFDEAHKIEDQIIQFIGMRITKKQLDECDIPISRYNLNDIDDIILILEGLDFDDITKLVSNFPIQNDLYVSSECPICFDNIDETLIFDMFDSLVPSECGQGVIYENCAIVLQGKNIYDPDGDEIIEYNWSRTKPNAYGIGLHFYNEIFNYGPRELGLDMEPRKYVMSHHLYAKHLGECCLFDIDFHTVNDKLIFQAPEVEYDIPLTFGLQVKDSGTNEFGDESKTTLRIRDLK